MKEIEQKTVTDLSSAIKKVTGEIESARYLFELSRKVNEPEKTLKRVVTGCVFAWARANRNKVLKEKIEEEMRNQRLFLRRNFNYDFTKHGDLVRKRYDPSYWLGNLPPDLNGNEEKEAYIGYRINCLIGFLESLE